MASEKRMETYGFRHSYVRPLAPILVESGLIVNWIGSVLDCLEGKSFDVQLKESAKYEVSVLLGTLWKDFS